MVSGFIYQHLAVFFEAVERAASAGRTQRLSFRGAEGETAGSLILDGGMIRFGVEFVDKPYSDATFSRGAMPYSLLLIKLLNGEKLSEDESRLLAKLPLSARRAARAVTARALRLVASLCDPSLPPNVQAAQKDVGSPLRISFSPLELMLAAGTSGDIRYEDAAASEYELPPGNPKERWLFEWHGESPRSLWPVMTTRLSERKVSAVADIGQFGQRLLGSLEQLLPVAGRGERTSALITTDEQLHYIVQSERYVALLAYAPEQGPRLRASLESMAERGKGLSAHINNGSGVSRFGYGLSSISGVSGISTTSSISNVSPINSVSSLSDTSSLSSVPSLSSAPVEALDSVSAGWIELQGAEPELVAVPTPEPTDPVQPAPERTAALNSGAIQELLAKLETGIDGFIGAAIADSESGICLGATSGGGSLDMEAATASTIEFVRAQQRAIETLGLEDELEDSLTTLGKQYHMIRPLRTRASVFIYMALDRTCANLGLARYTLTESERDLVR